MSEPRFGTDGIRGIANNELTPQLALKLGMAAAYVLARLGSNRSVIVGRDTRLSGTMLESALCAGLAALGADVTLVGVVPTPAVSQITLHRGCAAGVVISASHNPFEDNGIKFFGPDGKKLSDSVEKEIEQAMDSWDSIERPAGAGVGAIHTDLSLVEHYMTRLSASAHGMLDGLRLVLDSANGAAHAIAPSLFWHLGADVSSLHDQPDGVNINVDCGSTMLVPSRQPSELPQKVVEIGADAGLAFDGDCDRVMMADERGEIVDGDMMMAICALAMKRRGELNNDVVVATVMSNAGLEVALEREGIRLLRANVGDKYVAEMMEQSGAAIGGEQSGHILFPRLSPTGDGMLTGLQVLAVMRESGCKLSELASVVQLCPQVLRNIRVRSRDCLDSIPGIEDAIARARGRLGKPEWLSVRASGTEPLVRVMAQDTDGGRVEQTVNDLCDMIERHCGQ